MSTICPRLWGNKEFPDDADIYPLLVDDLVNEEAAVLSATADGLSAAVEAHRKHIQTVLARLLTLYDEKLYVSD